MSSDATRPLFRVPADGKLTPRQQFAYDLVRRPRTDADVGRWLHLWYEHRCSCSGNPVRFCPWAAQAGQEVLSALRRRGLLVRRRTGYWERLDGVRDDLNHHDPREGEVPY